MSRLAARDRVVGEPILPGLTLCICLVTLVGVAVGRYPGLRMNRATISLCGATLLVLVGSLTLDQAYRALDHNTIVLLLGMMVLSTCLSLGGFFRVVTYQVVRRSHSATALLGMLVATSGALSALLLNDTVVLMMTPLVVDVAVQLGRNPIPYLMALATAANIGSLATMVGNPQNMLIGMASGMSYHDFTGALAPVALAGLLVSFIVIRLVYASEFVRPLEPQTPKPPRLYRPLLLKSLIACVVLVVGFLSGLPLPLCAMVGASYLLVTRRVKAERILRRIDWGLLIFFSGLFVVTGALEQSGLSDRLFAGLRPLAERGPIGLTLVAVGLSNLVSNVPAVLLFRPHVAHFSNPQQVWLLLAMSTTLAGNLTLLGSVANLIVAETARRQGVELRFWEYLKTGLPITLITVCLGWLWLW